MPTPLAGPGQGLPFPQNLYPSQLANSPYDASSNRQSLAPGESIVLPAGDWYVTTGFYCIIQHLDPVTGTWIVGQGGAYERGMSFVKSDGFNVRVANMTGCPVGAVIVQYGSGWVQSSTTIAVVGSTATFAPVVGGQLSAATVTSAGAGYGVAPLVFIAPPPPAANNANGVGGVQAHAYAVIASGTVSAVTYTNPGAGYPSTPKMVIVPSPFDPNLATGITAATVTASITGSGSITAVLCTNSGAPITPTAITLTPTGAGSQATVVPIMCQCVTAVSLVGTGTGLGAAPAITTFGGVPSTGTITTSPEFNHTYWIPRPAWASPTITGVGSVTAQVATIIDGGLFMGIPTPIELLGSAAGGPAVGGGSVVGNSVLLTMGLHAGLDSNPAGSVMAAPTFSLSVTGYGAHNPVVTYKQLNVPDASLDAQTTATPASIGGIMADGDTLICKDPSGRLRAHKFDAERSDPSRGLYYLLPV